MENLLSEPSLSDSMRHCVVQDQHSVNGYYLTDEEISSCISKRLQDLDVLQQRLFKMQLIMEQEKARNYGPVQVAFSQKHFSKC
jgi:predicted double-glycine peptidase